MGLTEAEQNRLIISNMSLVPTIAADFRGGELDFEELLAIGRVGLVKAARSFDPRLGKFSEHASARILSALMHATADINDPSEWYPKEDSAPLPPLEGDKLERIFEWGSWGRRGNSEAICERWDELDCSPDELLEYHDEIKGKNERFSAAFISLNHIERKLVRLVFLTESPMTVADAAREIGISYWRATRALKMALLTIANVIRRMEINEQKPALAPA